MAFCRKSTISTGRNDRLKLSKLLNVTEHICNKTRQFAIKLLRNSWSSGLSNEDSLFFGSPGSSSSATIGDYFPNQTILFPELFIDDAVR